ncbi:hypothetical protein BGZ98_006239, partial [Dissophora globulifera]
WKYTVKRDALFLGSCDDGVRKLAKLCGWEGELQAMFEAGNIEMQLAEELEAMTLAKELEEETKALQDEEEKENDQDQKGFTKEEAEALDEITELLEATEISSVSVSVSDSTSTPTTTKVVATTVVVVDTNTEEGEEDASAETKTEKTNKKEGGKGRKTGTTA